MHIELVNNHRNVQVLPTPGLKPIDALRQLLTHASPSAIAECHVEFLCDKEFAAALGDVQKADPKAFKTSDKSGRRVMGPQRQLVAAASFGGIPINVTEA